MVQSNQDHLRKNLGTDQRTRPIEPRRRTTSPSSPRTLRTNSKRNQEEVSSTNEEKSRKLRRTDSTSHYFSQQASSSNSNSTIENVNKVFDRSQSIIDKFNAIYIPSDNEEEEQRLNREISDLYQQIKIKKERIEKIRIDRAVRQREIEIRRETRRWLPTLDRVNQVREEIINNLSEESDSDSELFDLPGAEELLDSIINQCNKKSKLNDVE